MADISATTVMELRQRTGLGMMECKRALTESDGDLTKAEELLRVKSGAKASKAASRVAAEGIVGVFLAPDAKTAAMVEVNCETDFVAKNDDFRAFANELAQIVARDEPADVAALGTKTLASGETVEARRTALVQKIGENMTIRRFVRHAANGRIAMYVHTNSKIGVLVDYTGGDDVLGKDIAMHIAALKPVATTRDQVPAETIEQERRIAEAKAAESDKPADIKKKMAEGGLSKALAALTLHGQEFVKSDSKQSVADLLKSKGAIVNAFVLYVVGEGIEKRKDDFAAEVAAMAKA